MSDLAILGAGSAGYAAALRGAALGLEVTLIDPGLLGGTCLNIGCIPTKAWLHAAQLRRDVLGAHAFGIGPGTGEVDAGRIKEHADGVVTQLRRGLEGLIHTSGATVVSAPAKLRSATVVEAGGQRIEAKAILVATGAMPVTLGLPVDGQRIITSDDALRLATLPARAVIVGGGVIGVEFASMWADLGVEVTLVEAAASLLPSEDRALTRVLARELASRGVDIRTGAGIDDVVTTDDAVRVFIGDTSLETDLVLIAAGRRPRTDGLGLDNAGVQLDNGYIVVDDALRSTASSVFAAGDVVLGPQLAHRGFAQGMAVAEFVAWQQGLWPQRPEFPVDQNIPRITYSTPQVASVGVTKEAAGAGAREVIYKLAGNGKSLIAKPAGLAEHGMVKVVQSAGGVIVGVHAVGDDVAELITAGALHVGWRAEPADVSGIVHPHPTVGEALGEAIFALGGRPLHMHARTDIG